MSLPWLEAMGPLSSLAADKHTAAPTASASPHPIRFAALYMPNGVNIHHWTPKGTGRDFELSSILEPLVPHKQDILVLSHLWNAATNTGDGHYVKTGGWLTSTTITRTTGSQLCAGNTSMDQLIAQRHGNFTPVPSLELGIEPPSTGVDTNVGFTQLYAGRLAGRVIGRVGLRG